MKPNKDLTLTVRFHARPGHAAELEAALTELAGASRKDLGCLRYDLYRGGEGEVLLLEHWAGRAYLEQHLAQAHVRRFRDRAEELFAAPSELLEWEAFDLTEPRTEDQ
ncbi:MAG: putative quinol monooxygenase [Desulfovibrio sp.]